VNWVLEADIVSFFDSLDRTELKKLIQIRGGRRVAIATHRQVFATWGCSTARLYRAGAGHHPGVGAFAAAGEYLSALRARPMVRREVKPRLLGKATLIRYATIC